MKKLFKLMLVALIGISIVGCGTDSGEENDDILDESIELEEESVTALEKIEEVMTVEVEDEEGSSVVVYAYIGENEARFIYYIEIDESEQELADALNLTSGDLGYENYTYAYLLDSELQIYAYSEVTNEEIEEEIQGYLTEYDLTTDELKEGLQEKYDSLN